MRATARGWTIKDYKGGRLADIYVGDDPIECLEVREYDFATGEFGPMPTARDLRRAIIEWDDEVGQDYRDNVVAYL